jgi:hypothetical protein
MAIAWFLRDLTMCHRHGGSVKMAVLSDVDRTHIWCGLMRHLPAFVRNLLGEVD